MNLGLAAESPTKVDQVGGRIVAGAKGLLTEHRQGFARAIAQGRLLGGQHLLCRCDFLRRRFCRHCSGVGFRFRGGAAVGRQLGTPQRQPKASKPPRETIRKPGPNIRGNI